MVIKRGSIWWVELGLPTGSGPGYKRPVLVIQANEFNNSNINTVIVAIITSNLRLSKAPGNVFLKKGQSGLEKDSVINVSQIFTIDKDMLAEMIGFIEPAVMNKVVQGIKTVLSIK